MNDENKTGGATASDPAAGRVGVRLRTTEHSEVPVFANVSSVQGDARQVIVDFGFIEPAALQNAAARAGGTEEAAQIQGRVTCRVVVSLDVAAQLSQQLGRHLRSISERQKTGNG